MGYEPTMNGPIPLFPTGEMTDETRSKVPARAAQGAARTSQHDSAGPLRLGTRRPLRFGGLSLDTLTGVVQWRGRAMPLEDDEVEVLQVLMQNAGRIVSTAQLASQLGEQLDVAEQRIRTLHGSLRVAGSKCLPRYTNGLGYILWY